VSTRDEKIPNNLSSSAAPPKSLQDATSQQQAKATSNKHLSYVENLYPFDQNPCIQEFGSSKKIGL